MTNAHQAAESKSKSTTRRATKRARRPLRELEPLEHAIAEPGTPEWEVAWAGLAELSGDEDREAYDPVFGEAWQYMGAEKFDDTWRHVFRHRNHPRTQERCYLRVPASPQWDPKALERPEGRSSPTATSAGVSRAASSGADRR